MTDLLQLEEKIPQNPSLPQSEQHSHSTDGPIVSADASSSGKTEAKRTVNKESEHEAHLAGRMGYLKYSETPDCPTPGTLELLKPNIALGQLPWFLAPEKLRSVIYKLTNDRVVLENVQCRRRGLFLAYVKPMDIELLKSLKKHVLFDLSGLWYSRNGAEYDELDIYAQQLTNRRPYPAIPKDTMTVEDRDERPPPYAPQKQQMNPQHPFQGMPPDATFVEDQGMPTPPCLPPQPMTAYAPSALEHLSYVPPDPASKHGSEHAAHLTGKLSYLPYDVKAPQCPPPMIPCPFRPNIALGQLPWFLAPEVLRRVIFKLTNDRVVLEGIEARFRGLFLAYVKPMDIEHLKPLKKHVLFDLSGLWYSRNDAEYDELDIYAQQLTNRFPYPPIPKDTMTVEDRDERPPPYAPKKQHMNQQHPFQGMPQQGRFPGQQGGFPGQMSQQGGFPGQMPQQGYPPGQMPQQGYPPGQMPQQGYPPGQMPPQGYPPGQMPQQGYPPGQMPQQGGFPGQMPPGAMFVEDQGMPTPPYFQPMTAYAPSAVEHLSYLPPQPMVERFSETAYAPGVVGYYTNVPPVVQPSVQYFYE